MSYTEEELFKQLQDTMVRLFEIDAESVVPSARLYEDLDIDSIDAVNMIIEMKRVTDKKIPAERFREARTVGDVLSTVFAIVNE